MLPCIKCNSTDRYANGHCIACSKAYYSSEAGKSSRQRYERSPKRQAKNKKQYARYKISGYHRQYHLKTAYGMTSDAMLTMLDEQNHSCLICGKLIIDKPHVDHNHVTGHVRGLLCNNCNLGLGMFKDNPNYLRTAASYLEKTC